jgi:membrane-associated phospholipid phosphatase
MTSSKGNMKMHCKRRLCLGVFNIGLLSMFSQVHVAALAQTDTSAPHGIQARQSVAYKLRADILEPIAPKPLKWKAIVVPAGLITYGTLSVAFGWFDQVNLLGKRWATGNEDPNQKTSIDDYTEFVPVVAVYGLNLAGFKGRHNIVDATMLYTMSYGLAHLITIPAKRFTAERRPDSTDLLSFPSGHTSNAFLAAEFLRQEYKDVSPWIGAGGYAVALLTGYLRMYNNKHWFSDVVAGAGVGILSTRASYWIYPKLKNLILGKSVPSMAMFMPTWQQGPGICIVYGF